MPGLLRLSEQIGCVRSSWDKQSSVTETSAAGLVNALGEKLRWGHLTAVGQGRRGLGWEEAARLHFILLRGSGAAEPSAESRALRGAAAAAAGSRDTSCAEVGEQPCTARALHEQ